MTDERWILYSERFNRDENKRYDKRLVGGKCYDSHASEFVLGYMKCMARVISCYELDRAYFAAGGLSDLAMMQGQPF
jgi:hypothetical protein